MGIVNDMLHDRKHVSHGFLTFLNMLQPRWIITKIDGQDTLVSTHYHNSYEPVCLSSDDEPASTANEYLEVSR